MTSFWQGLKSCGRAYGAFDANQCGGGPCDRHCRLRASDVLGVLSTTPACLRQAIDLRFDMKNALIPLGEFDRTVDCLVEARASIELLDDPQRLCSRRSDGGDGDAPRLGRGCASC
jgi:hypothetical protein